MEDIERIYKVKIPDHRGNIPVARDILACAKDYQGFVRIEKDGRTVTGKSMIGILSLSLQNGDSIKVTCSGNDEFSAKLCLEKISMVIG